MVARTPPKSKKMLAALNPLLIRETMKKMDQCMARLQELQYTVAGGTKVVSGVNLSPRSTRGYLRTSLRCKQESLRTTNGARSKSPVGKFPSNKGEWKRMSLPAMLVGETLGEILQASQFAREIVSAVANKTETEDPKTPLPQQRTSQRLHHPENTQLKARRKKEKQSIHELGRSESHSPSLQRARSRINFKVSPPKENNRYLANRVSPRNKPWAKKAVLFPNPLFLSTPSQQQHKFCKTRSPIISRNKGTPHKFLIKSPPSTSKFQPKNKSPPPKFQATVLKKTSPKRSTASKLRRSFSPSRLATRLVSLSPLKGKRSVQKSDGLVSGLKQRPTSTMQFPARRI
ncbi:putative microtubule-binding protein TANGLED [Senna tora]|uniref:Putative microtubule-binding protein TANGLED n=1 Tax=Senna tora TaxID=362788 RepID=A0A834W0V1_9FABA|nr:putative microtubule-binding protein TANGLED [Senna tora]